LISGVTAAAVAVYWRRALYGLIASRIYLAWCAAAIILPIAAGRLFDLTQSYGTAIVIAAVGNALGILVALGLPRQTMARIDARRTASPAARSTGIATPTADG
jgi:MFS transporter, OFA family, oxalate/formate antiporter